MKPLSSNARHVPEVVFARRSRDMAPIVVAVIWCLRRWSGIVFGLTFRTAAVVFLKAVCPPDLAKGQSWRVACALRLQR
jgi:hypothetical protein